MAKSNSSQKTASPYQIYFVCKNGIKVYPISEFEYLKRKDIIDYEIISEKKWFIEVNNNGKLKTFTKKISSAEINESVAKTIIFYYNQLKSIK